MNRIPSLRRAALRGGVLLLTLVLLASFAALVRAAPWLTEFGPNLRANEETTDHQQEPSLAINPVNPRIMLVAAKDWRTGIKQVWHYRTTDGGTTWHDSFVGGLAVSVPNQSDPVVDWSADGIAYSALLVYDEKDFTQGGLAVARSENDGASWRTPVMVTRNTDRVFNDKEWMVVDRSNGPTRGNIYVSWTRFTRINARYERGDIVVSRSTDGGQTFSEPVMVNPEVQDDCQGSFPAIGPDGTLYVLWYNNNRGQHLYAVRSTDGGATFSAAVKIADVRRPPSPLPGSGFRMFVLPQLAVNPKTGTLAATWNDYTRENADTMLATSQDGGSTWSTPRRINDDITAADQFFPAVDYGPEGVLHLAWLDRRDDPQNLRYHTYYTQSTDDGATFQPNVRLSDAASDPGVGFDGTLIGDYIQVDAVPGMAMVAWIDTREGSQEIYTARIDGLLGVAATPTKGPDPAETPLPLPGGFADPAFAQVWQRAEGPVAAGSAGRGWTWGPAGFAALREPYAQSPAGSRLVQYFDKARMEINNPTADPAAPGYVTNGLLVVELVSGRVQVGDAESEPAPLGPAQVPVAGDLDSPDAPTYAGLAPVASLAGNNRALDRSSQVIDATLTRSGQVSQAPDRAALGLRLGNYQAATGHNIADVFWRFMTAQGPVTVGGALQTDTIFDWTTALGYPITEPYWVRARVAGQDTWLLVQAFQRRVLTYNPGNAPAWQVEMGNVGRHYYDWRYGPRPPRKVAR